MYLGPSRRIRNLNSTSTISSPQERPRAFFTPLATGHRDLSTWPRDLVDTYRLGWEDAMAAVAEGQFHIDDVVREYYFSSGRPRS